MEDIFVTKIIETEKQAEKIILDAKETANNLVEDFKLKNNLERKQLEKKYDDIIAEKQEIIKNESDNEFNKDLESMKMQVENIKIQSMKNYDEALKVLFTWRDEDGNS